MPRLYAPFKDFKSLMRFTLSAAINYENDLLEAGAFCQDKPGEKLQEKRIAAMRRLHDSLLPEEHATDREAFQQFMQDSIDSGAGKLMTLAELKEASEFKCPKIKGKK